MLHRKHLCWSTSPPATRDKLEPKGLSDTLSLGTHYSITLADRVRGTRLSEHSTAKLQALEWRPIGPVYRPSEAALAEALAILVKCGAVWVVAPDAPVNGSNIFQLPK